MRPAIRFLHLVLPLVVIMAGGAAAAQDIAQSGFDGQGMAATIGVAASVDRLSNDTPDWRETALELKLDVGPRNTLDLALGRTSRFGLHDNQLRAAYSLPLSSTLTATVDGNLSPSHQVLAQRSIGGELQYEFARAWLLHGGARSAHYDTGTVNQAVFMLEHYFSSYSWTLCWRPTRAVGTTAHGLEARGSYYYGDRNAVTLIVAGGEEAASIPGGVALTNVRSAVVTGRHWLDRHWALNYGAGRTVQGDLYSRNGINLGVQYAY